MHSAEFDAWVAKQGDAVRVITPVQIQGLVTWKKATDAFRPHKVRFSVKHLPTDGSLLLADTSRGVLMAEEVATLPKGKGVATFTRYAVRAESAEHERSYYERESAYWPDGGVQFYYSPTKGVSASGG